MIVVVSYSCLFDMYMCMYEVYRSPIYIGCLLYVYVMALKSF